MCDNSTLCPVCQRPISCQGGREKEQISLPYAISDAQHGFAAIPRRLNIDPEKVEQGLAKLVLTIVELIRQLLEKQAIRRVESGSLSDEEIERLGTTLMRLETKMIELKEHFRIDDLDIHLGPLGKLVD